MQKGVAALADGGSASAADDAGVAYVYALRGAVARVGRLAMQQAWNADLSADGRVRASLHDVLAARLAGRPLPAQIVTEALHALLFLCIADVQRVHRMLGRGGVHAGMSQVGVETEIAEVAASARSLMEQVWVPLYGRTGAYAVKICLNERQKRMRKLPVASSVCEPLLYGVWPQQQQSLLLKAV